MIALYDIIRLYENMVYFMPAGDYLFHNRNIRLVHLFLNYICLLIKNVSFLIGPLNIANHTSPKEEISVTSPSHASNKPDPETETSSEEADKTHPPKVNEVNSVPKPDNSKTLTKPERVDLSPEPDDNPNDVKPLPTPKDIIPSPKPDDKPKDVKPLPTPNDVTPSPKPDPVKPDDVKTDPKEEIKSVPQPNKPDDEPKPSFLPPLPDPDNLPPIPLEYDVPPPTLQMRKEWDICK